jgi:hypothetical protein
LANAGEQVDRGVPKRSNCDQLGHTKKDCTNPKRPPLVMAVEDKMTEPATGRFNDTATGDTHGHGGDEGTDTFGGGSGRQNDGACSNCCEQGYIV